MPLGPIAFLLLATGAAPAAAEPSAPPDQPLVCRGGERTTGSRIRTPRRCRTAAEWRREDEDKSRVPLSLRVVEGQKDALARDRPQ